MSRFRKISLFIVIAEILIIAVMNFALISHKRQKEDYYRVDAERVLRILESDEDARRNPEMIDLSKFDTLIRVRIFDADDICNNQYLVEEAGGKLWRIEYKTENYNEQFLMNTGMFVMLVLTVFLLLFISRKVLHPFDKMSSLTVELAKGNLSNPIKEDKNRFFGRFIWGIDMLREKLEDSKSKNLRYQKEKKTLLLSLSHDIKTPLSSIQLYAKALSEGIYETEEERKKAFSGIMKNADEVKRYVDHIHTLSRAEFMDFEVNMGESYLSEIMTDIEVYYKDKLSLIHTGFEVNDYDNVMLSCDRDRLTEAIQNIMENAIKYGDGKKITISFDEEENCKLISIENTGNSINENELPNLFDSFYRGSNAGNVKGNGLGLYIVKQLMTKMDGDVFVSADDYIFKVTLVVRKA